MRGASTAPQDARACATPRRGNRWPDHRRYAARVGCPIGTETAVQAPSKRGGHPAARRLGRAHGRHVTRTSAAGSTAHRFEADGYPARGGPAHRRASAWHGKGADARAARTCETEALRGVAGRVRAGHRNPARALTEQHAIGPCHRDVPVLLNDGRDGTHASGRCGHRPPSSARARVHRLHCVPGTHETGSGEDIEPK